MGLLRWLREVYEDEEGPTVATGVIAVGISLMFSVGVFLIINAHSSSQSQQLSQTLAAIKKSQDEGISLDQALAELKTASLVNNKSSKTSDTVANPVFETVTVKGTSVLQGNVSTNNDVTVGGNLKTKGDLSVTGTILRNGSDLDNLFIQNTSDDPQNSSSANIDNLSVGDLSVSGEMNFSGSLSTDGDLSVGGATDVGSLTVSGLVDAASLTTSGDVTVGGDLSVSGSLAGSVSVTGNLDAASISIGGTDLSNMFAAAGDYIQNVALSSTAQSADIHINGDIGSATLTTTGDATVGGNLTVSGSGNSLVSGNLEVDGSFKLGADDITSLFIQNNPTSPQTASINITGDIVSAGTVDAATLAEGGTAIDTIFQPAGNYIVNGDDISAPTLTSTGDTTVGGILQVGLYTVNDTGGNPFGTIGFYDGTSTHYGTGVNCTGSQHASITQVWGGVVTNASCVAQGSGNDLAEKFPSTQALSAGDVVSIDPSNAEHVVKSSTVNDNLAIGVVSTDPGETLGGPDGYPIALAGRVPVKVTNDGGVIAPGDYLTVSSTPGYAMKASPGQKIIGQALAGFSGSSGMVTMFVNVSGGNLSQASYVQAGNSLSSLNVSGSTVLNDLSVSGLATVQNLQVNGHIIGNDDTRGTVTIKDGDTSVHHDFTKAYDQTPAVVASPSNQSVLYKVTPTATGFDISLATPANGDIVFNYLVEQ